MPNNSIILVGGPDSGKSNFLCALNLYLANGGGAIEASGTPEDITYSEGLADYHLSGQFVPRSERTLEKSKSEIRVPIKDSSTTAEIIIPDIYGEIWSKSVAQGSISQEWMDALESSSSALLFVRVSSENIVAPLDWVSARGLMRTHGTTDEQSQIPTQVELCELLQFLEAKLKKEPGKKPRVALLVTAWDLLDKDKRAAGPVSFIEREFPLFAGAMEDISSIDVEIFGVSIGGDLKNDPEFRRKYLANEVSPYAFYRVGETFQSKNDISIPLAWLLGRDLNEI